jgi:hypothetical protein
MIFLVDKSLGEAVRRARAALDAGDSPDSVARAILQECRGISAIYVLRQAGDMSLGAAREIIERNWRYVKNDDD